MAAPKAGAPVAVIMAGGSGTRFWPLSRKTLPKQFLPLLSARPLLVQTIDRIAPLVSEDRIYLCSTEAHRKLLDEHVPRIKRRILEPVARNTAPCLMLSVRELLREGIPPETVMIVLPADHHIADEDAFRELLTRASALASTSRGLVTLGIVPHSPHTGYGYIEVDRERPAPGGIGFTVRRFVEKPDRARAESFLREDRFLWNAGIFLWRLDAIEDAFRRFLPGPWIKLEAARTPEATAAAYGELPAQPIDIAVLEKADNLYVLPAEMGWSDVGSWNALYELRHVREGENVVLNGELRVVDSHRNLVHVPKGKRIALVGVDDLIIVDTGDTLLIAKRDQDQRVKEVAAALDP